MNLFKGLARGQAIGLSALAAALLIGGGLLGQVKEDNGQAGSVQSNASATARCIPSADSALVIGQARQVGLVVDTKFEGYNLVLVVDRQRFARADYATVRGVAVAYFCGLTDNDVGIRSVEFRTSPSGAAISRFSSSDLRAAIG